MAHTFSEPTYSAIKYAAYRPTYPPQLYQAIMKYHKGGNDLAIDLGCGTGTVSGQILQQKLFKNIIGVDPSKSMLEYARKYIPNAKFVHGRAESLPWLETSSVDLVSAGTAAHWFEPHWWQEAARVLRPGGTIAIFIYGGLWPDPRHPDAEELRATMFSFAEELGFSSRGNLICHGMYDELPLPDKNFKALDDFERIDWNRDGIGERLIMAENMNLKTWRERVHTYGPMHRWKVENPSKIGLKDEDPAEKTLESIKMILNTQDEEGMEIECGHSLSLILYRRM